MKTKTKTKTKTKIKIKRAGGRGNYLFEFCAAGAAHGDDLAHEGGDLFEGGGGGGEVEVIGAGAEVEEAAGVGAVAEVAGEGGEGVEFALRECGGEGFHSFFDVGEELVDLADGGAGAVLREDGGRDGERGDDFAFDGSGVADAGGDV